MWDPCPFGAGGEERRRLGVLSRGPLKEAEWVSRELPLYFAIASQGDLRRCFPLSSHLRRFQQGEEREKEPGKGKGTDCSARENFRARARGLRGETPAAPRRLFRLASQLCGTSCWMQRWASWMPEIVTHPLPSSSEVLETYLFFFF